MTDVINKLVHVKGNFGEIDKVCAVALVACKFCCCGEPTCVSAHCFDDADTTIVVHCCVKADFHDGGCDIFCCTCKAGAMVCAVKVVVDGLGHADDVAVIAH